jgi:type I restriction enzyme M protein
MVTRRNRELEPEDIVKVATAYHNFKTKNGEYADVAGFCKVAKLEEIKEHDYVLTPGRYVGSEEIEEDDEAFEEKMQRLAAELNDQFAKSHELETRIKENLGRLNSERVD